MDTRTNKFRFFIGISCFYHDSGVSIVNEDQKILFAQGEERVTRLKHDNNFPDLSIREGLKYVLSQFSDSRAQIVLHTIYYENPNQKFRRILKSTKHFGSVIRVLKLAFTYSLDLKEKSENCLILIFKLLRMSLEVNINLSIYYLNRLSFRGII